ncbi:hypothetical protein H6F67_13120 [Microcoleus sp. FACHB-1515]|uniref:hypothetical protein n=1 Tax=Cyanophyceae TaxID=3028117 RepID=UPI0016856697|nr:hypothetical protein [Microcoleus sp. FACHB-1515]MBD2090792.1 hypothetical protein [Microcoleus sp. FACHB-1515]
MKYPIRLILDAELEANHFQTAMRPVPTDCAETSGELISEADAIESGFEVSAYRLGRRLKTS